jgi:hypothetical protein
LGAAPRHDLVDDLSVSPRGTSAPGWFALSRPRLRPRAKPDRGQYAEYDENEQHHGLGRDERRLGPGRRQVVKERDLQEPLRDEDEHIEIKRGAAQPT